MELRAAGICAWIFYRHDILSDISNSSSPDPSTYGEALADLPSTNCDINSRFRSQSVISNNDICEELAGAFKYYANLYDCPDTCRQWAAGNGPRFTNAYWELNSFKVYQAS